MKAELAESLLAKILLWTDKEKARERAIVQDFARYKYDEYQGFSPGRGFVESLALWLRQFQTVAERRVAYTFVRERLIFFSTAEMRRLVALAFPTIVRPTLIATVSSDLGISLRRPKAVLESEEYRAHLRRTLVLGLSDGARTDVFRRINPSISNEQIWHAYDISESKAREMQEELRADLTALYKRPVSTEDATFRTVVLLDDFTASGRSYIRNDECTGWDGKLPRILRMLTGRSGIGATLTKKNGNYSPGGSTGYSLSWLRQSTAFPCRAMVVAVSGL